MAETVRTLHDRAADMLPAVDEGVRGYLILLHDPKDVVDYITEVLLGQSAEIESRRPRDFPSVRPSYMLLMSAVPSAARFVTKSCPMVSKNTPSMSFLR